MQSDLQTALEKYETKAARCKKAAEEATDEMGREFYEVLSRYYDKLARDFRKVIAKRTAASQAASPNRPRRTTLAGLYPAKPTSDSGTTDSGTTTWRDICPSGNPG